MALTIEQQRAVAQARARRRRQEQSPPKPPGPPEELSFAEKYIAPALEAIGVGAIPEKAVRGLVQGGADPVLGAAQLVLPEGSAPDEAIKRQLKDYEASRGPDAGFDWSRMAGNVALSPLAMLGFGAPAAASAAGRIGQGMGMGAVGGATNPVTADDFWGEKAGQTAMGTAFGGALPGAWELTKGGGRWARNLVEPLMGSRGAQRSAGRLANEVSGSKRDEIINAMLAARGKVPGSRPTAGQAALPAGSAEFSALTEIASRAKPTPAAARAGEQQAARAAAIREIAKTPAELEAAKLARREVAEEGYKRIAGDRISPKSEAQLMRDAVAEKAASKARALQEKGKFETFAAENEVRGASFEPVPGMPRVSSRASNFPERAAEGVEAAKDAGTAYAARKAEENFLRNTMEMLKETVGLDERSLYPLLDRPSMQEALKRAAKGAQERGGYFPSKTGDKFSVANLQRMKEALDDIVRDPKTSGIGATEAREIESTRNAFVNWLENRSPAWKEARLDYKEASRPINKMVVGAELEKALTSGTGRERATAFANKVADIHRIPELQTRTKANRFGSAADILDPAEMGKVRGVADELAGNADLADLASRGMPKALKQVGEFEPQGGPNFLDRVWMMTNAIVNRASGKAGKRTMDALADLDLDPQALAKSMQDAAPAQRKKIVDALMRAQAVAIGQSQ